MTAHRRAFRLIRAERQMTNNNPTLTAGEAAETLGLARSTLAKLRLSGNGPLYCKLGRRVLYRTKDLEAWLETRVARNTSDADARLPKSLTGQQPSSRPTKRRLSHEAATPVFEGAATTMVALPARARGLWPRRRASREQ
jgi:excisionase family DNA binding protein